MMRAKEAVVFNFKIEYYYRHTYKLQKNPSAKRNVCKIVNVVAAAGYHCNPPHKVVWGVKRGLFTPLIPDIFGSMSPYIHPI